jgi:hypothetical protein
MDLGFSQKITDSLELFYEAFKSLQIGHFSRSLKQINKKIRTFQMKSSSKEIA